MVFVGRADISGSRNWKQSCFGFGRGAGNPKSKFNRVPSRKKRDITKSDVILTHIRRSCFYLGRLRSRRRRKAVVQDLYSCPRQCSR